MDRQIRAQSQAVPLPIRPETCAPSPMLKIEPLPLDLVRVPVKRKKTLDEARVMELAEDIMENGQKVPIRVRADGDAYVLIEGFHRLEALRALGEATVNATVVHARLH